MIEIPIFKFVLVSITFMAFGYLVGVVQDLIHIIKGLRTIKDGNEKIQDPYIERAVNGPEDPSLNDA